MVTYTYNRFKGTTVYGTFQNSSRTDITDAANAIFDGHVTITGDLSCNGNVVFNSNLPTSTITPTLSTNLITKAYADATYSATGGTTLAAVQSNNNTFTGTNAFAKDIVTNSMTVGLGNGSNSSNAAFGNGALGKTTGGYNLAIGGASLFQNLGGIGNTGVGYQALAANTTGNYNMGFGYCSLNTNQTGSFNIGIGTT